ncbi:MAG: hydrogen gas-evolving membrane-bound hydrogenase subunit E [Luteolibacter sp.]
MMLLPCVLSIALAACVAPALARMFGANSGKVLALVPLGVCGWLLSTLGRGDFQEPLMWMASFNAPADMRIDGISRLMAVLVSGIGALVVLFASGYMGTHKFYGRFNLLLMLFMASMLGVVLADGLILLFIFWELTSITSYLLIGFNHENATARKKALQALIVTGGGGLALLAGIVMTGLATGEWTLTGVLATGDLLRGHAWYPWILGLVLGGCFTKSAQFPFHFWLPNAMAGPTPVSAYLHSATMVKAGVFLLAVLSPVLAGTQAWTVSLTTAGGITFLLAVTRGLFQTDLKTVLAFTTLAVLGMLVMMLGIGTELAVKAATLFLFAHALYKAALFMVVGTLDHETGTREVEKLRGLRRALPITAVAAGLAAFSGAGFPPFFGFLGKEYILKAGADLASGALPVLVIAVVGNAMMLALMLKVGLHPFVGPVSKDTPKPPHEAPFTMWTGPIVLASLGLALGLFPSTLAGPFFGPAAGDILGKDVASKLSLWHGFNLPLYLSIATIAAGLLIYRCRSKFWALGRNPNLPRLISADAVYDRCLYGLLGFAKWQTKLLQNGHLRNYLLTIFATMAVLLIWKIDLIAIHPILATVMPVQGYYVLLLGVMTLATVVVVRTHSKTTALISMGVVGFGISLLFTYFGAPDLAITQIVVETLTIVLVFLILARIPEIKRVSSHRMMIGDAIISIIIGGLATVMVLKAVALDAAPSIAGQLGEWSYTLANGRNVVNVILVDFRALDTFGEVLVLVVAALGVGILMTVGRKVKP